MQRMSRARIRRGCRSGALAAVISLSKSFIRERAARQIGRDMGSFRIYRKRRAEVIPWFDKLMVRQAHHEDEHKLTMRGYKLTMRINSLKTLDLILSKTSS